ncbi:MAG: hypothetical protein IT161_10655 [Bryobacterales bacterium]|nr:hypothetical protein [Bryobacterales bacterium]
MVDIHSHILPGLDDGAHDMDESLEMVKMAAETGTTDIVATPHADQQYRYHPGLVRKLIDELQTACGPDPKIHQGCDFHLHSDNIEDALLHTGRYTVNGTQYLLVELDDAIHTSTPEYFDKLERAGIKIILTHPERYAGLREMPELVEHWVAAGRLMQVTAQSLLGRFGQQASSFSRHLMDRGLVHIIASDAHNTHDRVPVLSEAREWVETQYSGTLAHLLFDSHPRAVIEGRDVDLSRFPPQRKSLWSRFFSRRPS